MNQEILDFFMTRPTDVIAADLLGRKIIYNSPTGQVGGFIVETEAYMGQLDRAAHSYGGRRTPANEGLYQVGGSLYIYSQRQYFFLDIATQEAGQPEGILIRAIEPTIGTDIMEKNRLKHGFELTNGPGKLMQAFGITNKDDNLLFLPDSPYSIDLRTKWKARQIATSPRIGINMTDQNWATAPLRFFVAGNPFVSKIKKKEIDLSNYGWDK